MQKTQTADLQANQVNVVKYSNQFPIPKLGVFYKSSSGTEKSVRAFHNKLYLATYLPACSLHLSHPTPQGASFKSNSESFDVTM